MPSETLAADHLVRDRILSRALALPLMTVSKCLPGDGAAQHCRYHQRGRERKSEFHLPGPPMRRHRGVARIGQRTMIMQAGLGRGKVQYVQHRAEAYEHHMVLAVVGVCMALGRTGQESVFLHAKPMPIVKTELEAARCNVVIGKRNLLRQAACGGFNGVWRGRSAGCPSDTRYDRIIGEGGCRFVVAPQRDGFFTRGANHQKRRG